MKLLCCIVLWVLSSDLFELKLSTVSCVTLLMSDVYNFNICINAYIPPICEYILYYCRVRSARVERLRCPRSLCLLEPTTTSSGIEPTTTSSGIEPTTTTSGIEQTTTSSGIEPTTSSSGILIYPSQSRKGVLEATVLVKCETTISVLVWNEATVIVQSRDSLQFVPNVRAIERYVRSKTM